MEKECQSCGKTFTVNRRDGKKRFCLECEKKVGENLAKGVVFEEVETKGERLETIEEEFEAGEATIKETQEQLAGLRKSLKELDSSQKEKLAALLEELPESSPKAIIDKVFKAATPKRTQLIENIGKLDYVLDNLGRKKSNLELEKRRINNKILEERKDEQAKSAFEKLADWLGNYSVVEQNFLELKETIQEVAIQDPHWHQRFKECGFDQVYSVIGDSHLKPEGLRELSIAGLIERVSNLGDTYGKNPLEHSQELKGLRQAGEDAHMFRKDFIPGSFQQVVKA